MQGSENVRTAPPNPTTPDVFQAKERFEKVIGIFIDAQKDVVSSAAKDKLDLLATNIITGLDALLDYGLKKLLIPTLIRLYPLETSQRGSDRNTVK